MAQIIKTKKVDSSLKEIGIYSDSIYKIEDNKLINERGESLEIQWWLLDYETLS